MLASEKLIIMLELNKYNIDSLFRKKLLESEKTGNLSIHECNTYSDIVISNYLYQNDKDVSIGNPFSYKEGLNQDIDSLDQLSVRHPEVGKKLSIKEFLTIEIYSETDKKTILNDVVDTWINDYRESKSNSLKNLQELFFSITKDNNNFYKKPSKIALIIALILIGLLTSIYLFPQVFTIKFIPSIATFINDWSNLLHEVLLYRALGALSILFLVIYLYQFFALSWRINNIVKEKKSKNIKEVYKWTSDIDKSMSKQFKRLRKYIVLVLKKPSKSKLDLKKLSSTEKLFTRYRNILNKVEKKYNWINKNHLIRMKQLRITYLIFILCNIAIVGFLIGVSRGLINV